MVHKDETLTVMGMKTNNTKETFKNHQYIQLLWWIAGNLSDMRFETFQPLV